MDYQKLNAATVTDAFPLPFTDGVLDAVVGHEVYSFLDGFSGYNQIRMNTADKEKTAFVTVEIQAQHRPSRLKKPRTESVGTDRLGRVPSQLGPIGDVKKDIP